MKNYKITFRGMRTVAFQQQIMFDGLLAYAYIQEHGTADDKGTGKLSIQTAFDFSGLPLERHRDGYWMGSWMFYDENKASKQVQTSLKKWDEQYDYMADFGKAQRAVHIDRGEFKTTQIPIQVVTVPEVWFFFRSDNVDEVSRLIEKHIAGIGKKVSRGHGFFSHFTIEELAENPFDEIIRPIPATESEVKQMQRGEKYEYRAWTFPYWETTNFQMCRVK